MFIIGCVIQSLFILSLSLGLRFPWMILPLTCGMITLKNIETKCIMNKEKKRWMNKIWNDKYPFEACATGRYPLRHVLRGVTLWGNICTGKACLQSHDGNNVVVLAKWDWVYSGISEPWDDDTLAHEHRDGFKSWCSMEWKISTLMSFRG